MTRGERTLEQMMEVLCALGRAYPGNRRLQVLYDEVAGLKANAVAQAAAPGPSLMRDVARVMMEAYPERVSRGELLEVSPKFGQQLWALRRRHGVEFRKSQGMYWLTSPGAVAVEGYLGAESSVGVEKSSVGLWGWVKGLFQ